MYYYRTAPLLQLTLSAIAQTSRIQGVVIDDSGPPVSGVYTVAATQSPTDQSTYSSVTQLERPVLLRQPPDCRYTLCVHAPGGIHLSNCDWASPSQAAVATGQTASQPITVSQDALLEVRIDDPNQLISPADEILIGIYLHSGLFQPPRDWPRWPALQLNRRSLPPGWEGFSSMLRFLLTSKDGSASRRAVHEDGLGISDTNTS
jgi:hypothetical protein